jgi:hypothetical protein
MWINGFGSQVKIMAVKHLVAGSFLVASGFVAGTALAAGPSGAPAVVKRPAAEAVARRIAPSADLRSADRLIQQRVADVEAQRQLQAIVRKIGTLKDPGQAAAWGLGCGAGCAAPWNDQPADRRAEKIRTARLSAEDQRTLLEINTAVENLGKAKGGLVAAWGLGCGGSCSTPLEELGNVANPVR